MEIHPPEHPVITKKQFFVHMAIVVLGLLIALGLDQTVEHLHQRSEVHKLEQAVELDNREIVKTSTIGQQQMSDQLVLLSERAAAIRAMLKTHHQASARIARIITEPFDDHSDAAWKTAKANGIAPLVSENENEIFSLVDAYFDQLNQDILGQWVVCTKRIAFEKEFAIPGSPDQMDLSQASTDDLTRYLELLREERAADVRTRGDYAQLRGVATTILEGVRDAEKVNAADFRFLGMRQFMEQ